MRVALRPWEAPRPREGPRLGFSLTPIEAVNRIVMMIKNASQTLASSAAGAAKLKRGDACAESFFGTLKPELTYHKT